MSWKPEVIADNSGKWCGNLLRFATCEEAEANAQDLARRWTLVRQWRATESEDPVTHAWVNGKSVQLVAYGMIAVGFANGGDCPHAGEWLKSFDHEFDEGRGFGEFTRDPKRALRFTTREAAMEFWRRSSTIKPLRPDGRPNRPLTGLTVSVTKLP